MPETLAREHTYDWLHDNELALGGWLVAQNMADLGASQNNIIKNLGVVAEVLQVELPSPGALRVIADLLKDIPALAWPHVVRDVCKMTKRWGNRMPEPKAFLDAAELHIQTYNTLVKQVELTIRKLNRAKSLTEKLNEPES